MQKHRRLLRLGIAAFIVGVLFWMGFVPERRDRVFRAMPANSPFVSEHINLSGVWRDRFDNPLLVGTLAGAGVRNVEDWSTDTNIVWIVRLVSGPRSLIGWSPALGPSATPCWTGASWVGLRGPLLRAMLLMRWVPGLGRLQTTALGTRYMYTASKRKQARGEMGLKLGFILRENVLLVTLGDDPDAVRALDWRLTHDAPLAPIFADDPKPWLKTGSAPHRVWVAAEVSPVPLPFTGTATASITAFAPDRIALSLTVPAFGGAGSARGAAKRLAGRCTAADALAADAACALLLLPAATTRNLIDDRLPGLALFGPTADTGEDTALYLTTQALGGRVFGLAVPAITLMYPGPADTPGAVTQAVARVAAATNLRLRTYEPEHNVNRRLLVDWLGGSRHIRLSRDDCTAVELHPGWLTLCTSAASLDAQRQYAAETPGAWRALFAEQLADAGVAGLDGFLWLDLARTTYELRQIYAVYRLATSLGAIRVTEQETAVMNGVKTALDALNMDGAIGLAWRLEDESLHGSLQLRAPRASPGD